MHDIKYIRNNFDTFKKQISLRNNITNIDIILDLDQKNRQLIKEKETLEKQKKIYQNLKMKKCSRNQKKFL